MDLIEQKKRREQARSKSDDESDASSNSKNSSKEPSHKTSHKKSYHKKQSHKNGSSKSHKKKTREPAKKMNGHHESDAMSEDSDGSKRTTKTMETEETTNTDNNNNNTRQPTKPINNPSPDKDERMEDMEKDQERAEEQALETDKRKEVEEENEEEQEEEEQIEEEEVIQPVVDLPKMEGVVRELVAKTENFSVEELVQIHATIYAAMRSHHASADKSPLVQVDLSFLIFLSSLYFSLLSSLSFFLSFSVYSSASRLPLGDAAATMRVPTTLGLFLYLASSLSRLCLPSSLASRPPLFPSLAEMQTHHASDDLSLSLLLLPSPLLTAICIHHRRVYFSADSTPYPPLSFSSH